eukprot:TRINITY_DN3462_c0_g1_i3.p1 TRINITY_DN3462_c0_g1~~TRINITY_DN3462_c0_g1_i3.p1  ORF type:complete len:1224 (+),score=375.16 TRINITY_DN3462_c0_g1_i3:746-4417(+)
MTLIDHQLVGGIKIYDLLDINWHRKLADSRSTTLEPLHKNYKRTVRWIASSILSTTSKKKRAAILGKFIKIGDIFLLMQNYNGVAKIHRALTLSCISRLSKTWKRLSSAEKHSFENICKIVGNNDLHGMWLKAKSCAVPSFGSLMEATSDIKLYVDDIEPQNGANAVSSGPLLSVGAILDLSKIVETLQISQRLSYNITADARTIKYLRDDLPSESPSQLSKKSFKLEPPDLESQDIYFGKATRTEVEEVLLKCEEDSVIITKKGNNTYDLCAWNAKKRQYLSAVVEQKENGYSFQGNDTAPFRDVKELLDFSKEYYQYVAPSSVLARDLKKKYKISGEGPNLPPRKESKVDRLDLFNLADQNQTEERPDPAKLEQAQEFIRVGNIAKLIELFREGLPLNTLFKNESTILHVAVELNIPMLVDFAMEYHKDVSEQSPPDINARNSNGFTAIHLACTKDFRARIISSLFRYGADINIPNKDGATPLHHLVKVKSNTEDRELLESLILDIIKKGSAVNAQDADKDTPLHEACVAGNLQAVKYLIEHGADTTLTNRQNQIPLSIALKNLFRDISDELEKYPISAKKNAVASTQIVLKNPDFAIDAGSTSVTFKHEFANLRLTNRDQTPFKYYFKDREHTNIVGKTPHGVLVVSITSEENSQKRMLVRTPKGDANVLIPETASIPKLIEALKFFAHGDFFASTNAETGPLFLLLDETLVLRKPTFGLIFIGDGRFTADKIFEVDKSQHSAGFEDFLNYLGKKVGVGKLVKAEVTGNTDYYVMSRYKDQELEFHIPSALSTSPEERQKLAFRQGVLVVFLESCYFDLSMLAHAETNVVFIIQPVRLSEKHETYRMFTCRRKDINKWSPLLHAPPIFLKEYFKTYFMTSLVNADHAAPTTSYSRELMKTRESAFDYFYENDYRATTAAEISAGKEQYKLGRVVGTGQTGVCYECKHKKTRETYCMKIVDKTKLEKEVLKRVEQEVGLLTKLKDNSSIIRFYEKFENDEELSIVLELCQGGSLKDDVKMHGKYTENQTATVIYQILEALHGIHEEGIAHRDLKPDNILFADKERKNIRVIDFGLAKDLLNQSLKHSIAGTLDYVAPEVLEGLEYDYLKVDLWSVGCICFYLLYGEPPFARMTSMAAFFNAVRTASYNFDDDIAPVSEEAKSFMRELLEVDYLKRPSASEALKNPWLQRLGRSYLEHSAMFSNSEFMRKESVVAEIMNNYN